MKVMEVGLVLAAGGGGTPPAVAAQIVEKHGFSSFAVSEPNSRLGRVTAAAVTSRIALSTVIALPVQPDPASLPKPIAQHRTPSHGRVPLTAGFGRSADNAEGWIITLGDGEPGVPKAAFSDSGKCCTRVPDITVDDASAYAGEPARELSAISLR